MGRGGGKVLSHADISREVDEFAFALLLQPVGHTGHCLGVGRWICATAMRVVARLGNEK
jgi:hypothetical protein